MNEYYQKRIVAIIEREFEIDKKMRVDLEPILKILPTDKRNNLYLSIETIQNVHFKNLLEKIKDELSKTQISEIDEIILNSLTQNRIDEILEFNLTKLSEKEQKKISDNLGIINDISKNIDKNKY